MKKDETIQKLMNDVAEWHGITYKELRRRMTEDCEPLVHQYYIGKYGPDPFQLIGK